MLTFCIGAIACCIFPPMIFGIIGYACFGIFGGIVGILIGIVVFI
jgi:hypothetical protein